MSVPNTSRDLEKSVPSQQVTPAVIDWEGPDDSKNPLNWSPLKKAYHTAATAFLGFAVTAGSSLITPSTTELQEYFQVSRTASILALSLFVLGLGIGPALAAPISETFGRSVVYKISGPLYLLFILGSGFSKSFGALLTCRLLAGISGGPVLAVGSGTNADMYSAQYRAVASSLFVMMPFLGPSIGPVIGGFVAQYKGWRWTQWCTIFIGFTAVLFLMPMHETYKKIILERRAKRADLQSHSASKPSKLALAKTLFTVTLARPVHMLCTEPITIMLSLYTAFTFSVLFAFFAAYPYVFRKVYHFNTWQYGLTFLPIGLGVLLGVATVITIDKTWYKRQHQRTLSMGKVMVAPEYRLLSAQMGCFGVSIGLFWFAWTARTSVHWIVPVLAGIPFAWGNLCVFVSAALYLIDTYGPLIGASAMAANGLARYTLGAALPLFTIQMLEGLGIPWAISLLGFLSLVMLPIPWVFFIFGPRIRAKSGYDTFKD
ncbi:putative MFS polyamine transporter [Aureobasidium sp. EXF-10728]|nr:putative MFS polyamine transporter [Aureobasidium sp. EXF-10728]